MNATDVITDFTCALPGSGWTDADSHVHRPVSAPPEGLWRVIDFKSEAYEGRALLTTRRDSCVLTVPLAREGWHAVSLGMSERQWGQAVIEVRLSGEHRWQLFRTSGGDGGPLHEEPWCFADLTGRDLEVRFPPDLSAVSAGFRRLDTVASLYSVRMTPVLAEHVPLLVERRHRPMVYINDGFGIFYNAERPGPHIVGEALGGFAEGDWDTCSFGNIGGDLVNFPSEHGTLCGCDGWDFVRAGDARCKDNLSAMIAAGEDPLSQAVRTAHAQGHRCWMYLRPQAYTSEPPYDHILRSRFFAEHPELRCVEANGKPISKLSIAYDSVRMNLNHILTEALARGADGLTLAFVRGYPCVRYEPPVVERMRELHGVDARELPDSDPRLRRVWAGFVAAWLKEVRVMLDESGPSPMSPRRQLSVIVGPDAEWNLRFGFDVAAWARDRLVDAVMPYPYVREEEMDIRGFVAATEGTAVQVLPSIGTFNQNVRIATTRRRAHAAYLAGADGLSRWDCPAQLAHLRLGDPVRQALWCEHYFPRQNIEMTEFAGQNLEAFGPMLGF